jgi:hypothetical protein
LLKVRDLPETAFRSNDKQKSRRDAARLVFRRLAHDSLVSRTSQIDLPRRSACGESHHASAKTFPLTLQWSHANRLSATVRYAHASGVFPSEVAAQTWSYIPWINRPDIYRSRDTHANTLGRFAHMIHFCAAAKHLLKCLGNPWILN